MGGGLAGEQEVIAVQQHLSAKRLMSVEVITQHRVIAGGVARGVGGQPALGGVNLAILFALPVLWGDELRAQRHDLAVAGADDDRSDGTVEMGGLAPGVPDAGTVGTMDVVGLGGEIPSGIQGDEAGVANRAHRLQQTHLRKGLLEFVKKTEQLRGRDRVERLSKMVVGRDALNLKEGAGVMAAARLFHMALEAQERGALGEKDREGRQNKVGHLEETVGAGAPVRQSGGDRAKAFDESIEAVRVHPQKKCRYGPKSTSYNGVTRGNNQVNSRRRFPPASSSRSLASLRSLAENQNENC